MQEMSREEFEYWENKCEDKYYFEDNRDKFTVEMLDEEIEEGTTMSVREWLEYGISCEYIEDVEDFTKLTTSELSHMIDLIDYLETK